MRDKQDLFLIGRESETLDILIIIGKSLTAILEANGTSFDKVVKTTCFLADMSDFAAFNAVYAEAFVSRPARSCVAVKTLPKNVLCEIEAIAAL